MKKIPKFKTQKEEADFWMKHDTVDFWDDFEDIKEPLEIFPRLQAEVRDRHEKAKLISIRLYPSQLRMAKAIADKKHVPYQVLLRSIIDTGLSRFTGGR
ncbi:CopG family antitoxin [Elusimicrobiota bacterium]